MHHDDERFADEERDTFEVSRRTCVVFMPPLMSAIKSAISCSISWSTADAVTVQPMVELHPKNAAPIVTPSAKLCTRSPRMTFQHTGCRVMMSVNTLSLLASIKTWRFCAPSVAFFRHGKWSCSCAMAVVRTGHGAIYLGLTC